MTMKGFTSERNRTIDKQRYSTLQPIGSGKNCQDVITKSIYQVNNTLYPITAIQKGGPDQNRKMTITGLGADSRIGDVVRFIGGLADRMEVAIVEVIDNDTVVLGHDDEVRIQIGDEVNLFRHNTLTLDEDGSLNVSVTGSGPIQFVDDGIDTEVEKDSVDPTNNKPLPSAMYIEKDGVLLPVTKDTGDINNTISVPVEIVGMDGTEINITAGDINVQLTDQGANADVVRIGDGTNQLGINTDLEGLVHDQDTHDKLDLLQAKTDLLATEAKQDLAIIELQEIEAELVTLNADVAKEAKQDAAITELQEIEAQLVTLNSNNGTGANQNLIIAELQEIESELVTLNSNVSTEAKQDAAIVELQEIEAELTTLNTDVAKEAKQDAILLELQNIAGINATQMQIVEDYFVQDFAATQLNDTYATIKTLTATVRVMKVLNNSGGEVILRINAGKEMIVGQGGEAEFKVLGVPTDLVEMKGLSSTPVTEGKVYINFEG